LKRRETAGQAARRREHLKRQKAQRQDVAMRARRLLEDTHGGGNPVAADGGGYEGGSTTAAAATTPVEAPALPPANCTLAAPQPMDATGAAASAGGGAGSVPRRRRRVAVDLFATDLMAPEWMVSVPEDLPTQWFVLPRPQGKRCLVVASRGTTTSRARNGGRLERFQSRIPGGGRSAEHGNYSILDCVRHAADGTYYVLDCMCWNGQVMYDCTAEFRLFWLQSKLAEAGTGTMGSDNARRFLAVPSFAATPSGIVSAYSEDFGYKKDCLLFVNKDTHYQPGVTPLALLWKDAHVSEYFIESRSAHEQIASLTLGQGGELLTSDNPPVTVASFPMEWLHAHAETLAPGV
jgi:snurportin-1